MADGLWHTQTMEEGANQGCQLLATPSALILGEVLRPLDAALKTRAQQRFIASRVDTSDDGAGDETHPMGYIDDVGAAIPHVNIHSSLNNLTV